MPNNFEYVSALEDAVVELYDNTSVISENTSSVYKLAKSAVDERNTSKQILIEMHLRGSSNIAAVGYNQEHKALRVEFSNSGVYQYQGVPVDVYEAMLASSSIGSYFSKNIRNQFKCVKLK